MRYAIMSDVHGNPAAFADAIADARRERADRIFCLGDVVGYGPDPAGAIALCRESCAVTLMGNHDAAVAGVIGTGNFIPFAQDGVRRHSAALGDADRAWLGALPYLHKTRTFVCAHGTPMKPELFFYMMDAASVIHSFDYLAANARHLLFVGHTHHACSFVLGADRHFSACGPDADLVLEKGAYAIVNVGSVGYPRSDRDITYVIYDTARRTVRFRHLPFDFRKYADSLAAAGATLPLWLADIVNA